MGAPLSEHKSSDTRVISDRSTNPRVILNGERGCQAVATRTIMIQYHSSAICALVGAGIFFKDANERKPQTPLS